MTKKTTQDSSGQNNQGAAGQPVPPDEDISLDDLQKKVQELEQQDATETKKEEQVIAQETESQKKIEELTATLARALADLQNYRRRTEEERLRWMHVAQADLLKSLLPILDNFDRCSQHFPESLKDNEWAKGVLKIHDNLMDTLAKIGVKRIETVGKKIDPLLHEALLSAPGEKDVIIAELGSGYLLRETVLKPAKVSVGNGEHSDEKPVTPRPDSGQASEEKKS
ncbi:nucleotide exchange factor GrpE [Candidatus Peregrinibacteria bacterium]|nr:nucleotide exchange factor GrpE [Candidatus Peregrinibacteria bacterium]